MSNKLCCEKIKKQLKTEYIGKDLHFFEKTTSTFDEAQKLKVKNGTVICAGVQTNGRGRLGRQWESNSGGVFFSVVLMEDNTNNNPCVITLLCAVAIKRAIEKYIPCKIKWPNDIVSEGGKKICGILTKIQYDSDGNPKINAGIGINANTEGFDKTLEHASSIKLICGKEVDENALLCDCLAELEYCINPDNAAGVMEEFKKSCLTLNSRVKIVDLKTNLFETGFCTDINNDGTLTVRKDDGKSIFINSGEVSVRGIYGEDYV